MTYYYLTCAASNPTEKSDASIRKELSSGGSAPKRKTVSEKEGNRDAIRLMQAFASMNK